MDKNWIHLEKRWDDAYENGVKEFMTFAKRNAKGTKIPCPCKRCRNVFLWEFDDVEDHLYENGFLASYSQWMHHGEPSHLNVGEGNCNNNTVGDGSDEDNEEDDELFNDSDFVHEVLDDFGAPFSINIPPDMGSDEQPDQTSDEGPKRYARLLKEAQCELYPGCTKISVLSFLIKLLHVKYMNKWSNKSFDMILSIFKDALPDGEKLPKSYQEAQKLLRDLGMGYTLIHACKYHCVLYWKEYKDLEECPICSTSRWKCITKKGQKIPQKLLRYFPLKPRLQRLFMSSKTAGDMRWHKEKRDEEKNVLRHPADSEAWKDFDKNYQWFAQDSRNVRLGLASDGFNPFGNMSNAYSMWPVLLTVYNMPPWKCMTEPFIIMALLIPGPDSPGNNIDVYLRPLIDDLKELFVDGIVTYDAYSKQNFKLHASLLWTINDFPAYGMLSGWSTKGKLACPVCNEGTCSMTLKHGRKQCYMGHRRFLSKDHKWRRSYKFNGKHEMQGRPEILSGDDIPPDVTFGKHPNKKKRKRADLDLNWTKKSIFFELPYWRSLKLRHNLDVMHIEKNICESILGTLMNIPGKTKDNINSRLDLELLGIRKDMHVQRNGDKYVVPPACYSLDLHEKRSICEWLKSIKFPDGYASNISRCVNVQDRKISGLKSHDCHVLLRLLPIAVRGFLSKEVCSALVELSFYFRELCSKTLELRVLEQLEHDIAIILCKLELIFPPSFFDVMVYLAVHLAHEAKVGGPVRYRWMYFIERFLRTLKNFVRNKARPEGSIAEAYIDKECLTFCSMYLDDVETQFNQQDRNHDEVPDIPSSEMPIFGCKFRKIGAGVYEKLSTNDYEKARWYILDNCMEIETYLQEHKEEIQRQSNIDVEQRHHKEFPSWFERRMIQLRLQNPAQVSDDIYALALGPDPRVMRYTGCIVNGMRFRTEDRERHNTTQCSGLVVKGEHQNKEIDFYGTVIDIIEFRYCLNRKVYLFKCSWWDVSNKKDRIRKDQHFTSINMCKTWYANDPFVLAYQAQQVYYVIDSKNGGKWHIVQKVHPRNMFDVLEKDDESVDNDESYFNNDLHNEDFDDLMMRVNDIEVSTMPRENVSSAEVDAATVAAGNEHDSDNTCLVDDDSSDEDETMVDYESEEDHSDDFDSDMDL